MANKEINIVLVGETGVGKSTFINAFVNYLKFENLQEATNSEQIHCLIPCRFTIADDNFEDQVIQFGEDKNECRQAGASSTQEPRSYKFTFSNITVRLIDTPGIGDTRGIVKDEENFDKVLRALGELAFVHAFCILLKPNSARLTVQFEYCIKQLLSRLDKSACHNIVYVLTNSRSTFYKPGETSGAIKTLLNELKQKPPHVTIRFCKDNVFCMDNEAFRFLLAKRQNIDFSALEEKDFAMSWDKSANVCENLVVYIANLPPHPVQNTISVNEARRLILNLSQPLVDIIKNIDDNLKIIQRKQCELKDEDKSVEDLKKMLYYDVIRLNVVDLDHPRTVCTDRNCIEVYRVDDSKCINYKQVCHSRCYLSAVPKEVRGSPELRNCSAMNDSNVNPSCTECDHSYLVHMHIYYITEPYTSREVDTTVNSNLKEKEQVASEIRKLIEKLTSDKGEMESEKKIVQTSVAKFAHFLRNNAIAAYNDKYQDYINYLIENEDSLGDMKDVRLIGDYRKMIATHTEQQRILDAQLNDAKMVNPNATVITATDVIQITQELFALPRYGWLIKKYHDSQQRHFRQENLLHHERNIDHHWYDPVTKRVAKGYNKAKKYLGYR